MADYQTFTDVLDAFPSRRWLAKELQEDDATVRMWAHRKSIPSRYWPAVCVAAQSCSLCGVDAELLAQLAASRQP